jgi:hypothetical protein
LEMMQNSTTLDEVAMAPSYILREAWTLDQSGARSFGHFLGLALSNLLENDNSELRTNLSNDANFSAWLRDNRMDLDASRMHCRSDWNLTDSNI